MSEHFNVLIVGAGLSGVGAACHLKKNCPNKTFALLESRESMGGTWDLFRYPGVRSDSDMYTLGYAFKPWTQPKAIADGSTILDYIHETADEYGIAQKIRYRHEVKKAAWSSSEARWSLQVQHGEQSLTLTCDFLMICAGYYSYAQGYTPDFPGVERYQGQLVHPQHWPQDLNYKDKRVVVIGSGATAVTLVPAMAEQAAHVTMLQRSPTYMISRPGRDKLAISLRRWLPAMTAYGLTRWKNVLLGMLFFNLSRSKPDMIKRKIVDGIRMYLGPHYEVDKHFSPSYKPWDQRVCLVPDGDFFKAIRRGRASVVTDHIASFDEKGLQLRSGERLDADIVVTATGLQLLPLGGMSLSVDGKPVSLNQTMGYKGMMFSDLPNLATVFGYTNASWTLKGDLTCEYVCRVLNHMDQHGYQICTPRQHDPSMETAPWVDFTSGYVLRALELFPKQGTRKPWRLYQNYAKDIVMLKYGKVDDGVMEFARAGATSKATLRRAA